MASQASVTAPAEQDQRHKHEQVAVLALPADGVPSQVQAHGTVKGGESGEQGHGGTVARDGTDRPPTRKDRGLLDATLAG